MSEKDSEATLKTLREAAGKTQRKLGQELDISETSIQYWESGTKLPRSDKFVALAASLRVPLKVLARAMKLNVTSVPDDFPDVQSLLDTARDNNQSLKTIVESAGYDVSGVPDDNDDCNKS